MGLKVDIDGNSGFCAGVIRAIETAQRCLDERGKLFSLGDIVHNDAELNRLASQGMVTIDKEDLEDIRDASEELLLIRAHGEPPSTYVSAEARNFTIVDCTCPVVLNLQKEIRDCYLRLKKENKGGQIVIFGKNGHAEVNGLVGQADEKAIVLENTESLEHHLKDGSLKTDSAVELFSQTTKSPVEYNELCDRLKAVLKPGMLRIHNTICRQVATRHSRLSEFAVNHDIVIFVSGKASSNGKVLCELCKCHNIRTYHVDSPDEINPAWFRPEDRVGVCGATSTPKWLLEEVAARIENFCS